MFRSFALSFFALITPLSSALAQTSAAPVLPAYIEGVSENDLYSTFVENGDRWYTNGIRLEYGQSSADARAPLLGRWPRAFVDRLCGRFCTGAGEPETIALDRVGYALVSNTYTPSNTQSLPPDPRDRPYAGVLYVSQLYDRTRVREGRVVGTSRLSLDLGVLGPASGAGAIQRWWHRRIGAAVPRGWRHQIENEPIVQFGWREDRRVAALADIAQLWVHGRIDVGTLRLMAAAGAEARIGWFGRRLDAARDPAPFLSAAYVIGGVEGRATARSAVIDGGLFEDEPGVPSRTLVGQWSFGGVLEFAERVRLSYAYIERTPEFSSPLAKRSGYGSIALRLILPLP